MRSTLSRHLKKNGKLYLRVFSDHPVSKKPAETRMGKGKGDVETWVAVVKRERILVEVGGVDEAFAKKILHSVSCKLPIRTKFVSKAVAAISNDSSALDVDGVVQVLQEISLVD